MDFVYRKMQNFPVVSPQSPLTARTFLIAPYHSDMGELQWGDGHFVFALFACLSDRSLENLGLGLRLIPQLL